jgi:superfamily I DNA/RNA helicase
LNATELGLTCTYRCGKAIVRYAQTLVPDFRAAETNPEGMIETIDVSQLIAAAQVGDFVLSRKNAPIIGLCLKAIKAGKVARIEGRDVAAQLKKIIGRWKPKSMAHLLDNIAKWAEREIKKAEKTATDARTKAARVELVTDQAEILTALCEGLASPAELKDRIETLFADADDNPRPAIVFSSVHKAKGLEARTVFVLKDTPYPNRAALQKKGLDEAAMAVAMKEEANIEYVAVTRAIDRLVWVRG